MSKSKRVSEDTVELNENIENDEENFGEAFAKLKFLRKIKEKANKVKGDHADSDENDEIDENEDEDEDDEDDGEGVDDDDEESQ